MAMSPLSAGSVWANTSRFANQDPPTPEQQVIPLFIPRPQVQLGPLPMIQPLDPLENLLSPLRQTLDSLRSSSSMSVLSGQRTPSNRRSDGTPLTGATLLGGDQL